MLRHKDARAHIQTEHLLRAADVPRVPDDQLSGPVRPEPRGERPALTQPNHIAVLNPGVTGGLLLWTRGGPGVDIIICRLLQIFTETLEMRTWDPTL